jgi:hypothetical protein
MKRIIYDTKANEVIAIAQTQEMAHVIAESYSYVRNVNAAYGLYGCRLVDFAELCSTENGREAWGKFQKNLDRW